MGIGASQLSKAVWERAKDLSGFTIKELAALGASENSARRFCNRWQREGLVYFKGINDANCRIYAPVGSKKTEIAPVSSNPTPEGNMWRSIGLLGDFTATDVAAHSNAGGIQVTIKDARTYCRDLHKAEYLRIRVGARSGSEAVYRLIKNTGPMPPKTRQLKGLFDPNTENFIPTLREGAAWQRS